MFIRNFAKMTTLSAVMIAAPAMAAGTGYDSESTDSTVNSTVSPGADNPGSMNREYPANTDADRSRPQAGSMQQDRVGVVTFEENSTDLDSSAEQTLTSIARDLDKNKPTELTVEVSGAVRSAPQTGQQAQPSGPDSVEQDRSETPGANQQADSKNMESESKELAEKRAGEIRQYLVEQGIQVREVNVGDSESTVSTGERNTDSGMTQERQDDRQNQTTGQQQDEVQKLRIVITERLSRDGVSAL